MLDILEGEEVLTQFFLRDVRGGLMLVLCKLPNGPNIHLLSPFRHPPELQILDHPLLKCGNGSTSCACELTVLHRKYSLMKMAGGIYQDDFERR